MRKIILFIFTASIFITSSKFTAQEKYGEYLKVIANTLPEVYVKSTDNLFFTVQIAAFTNKNSELEKINNIVIAREEDNLFKYRLGEFPTYEEAVEYKRIVLSVCNDAFIVSIKNGKRIHIKEALKKPSANL
ncbi:hypothetical protein H9I45_15640 [Polaribacter haliotis]|uniref:SPOR domain-containing protein n=1 Tax=Polaribacter haliotis TaxID=1888915 RepID=A0A7L8AFG6_9FLAO|nr:hypothetical protein [Polaribacter haliotis]QOD60751.1 hypothetical protein H9I45_15640 [Polaribacter haliotis]